MTKRVTFTVADDTPDKLKEVAQSYRRSKSSTVTVLVDEAHTRLTSAARSDAKGGNENEPSRPDSNN